MTLQERLDAALAQQTDLEQQHAAVVEKRRAIDAQGVDLEKQLWKIEGAVETLQSALKETV